MMNSAETFVLAYMLLSIVGAIYVIGGVVGLVELHKAQRRSLKK